jgi:hypothetical protein
MRKTSSFVLIGLFALPLAAPATAARQADLDTWLSRELTPYLTEQLTTHPRFKGELVRFVVFKDGNPAPTSDELAVSLRDRLADAVIDVPGVRVAWPHPSKTQDNSQNRIDCSRDTVHYFIGLEISKGGLDQYRVDLRALDIEDRSWVTGFAKSWQGRLGKSEQRASRRSAADRSFLGQRAVPFTDEEPDLLAAYIAHDLGCGLLRQVSGEYVVILDDEDAGPLRSIVELVSNNLAAYRALQVTEDAENANATLGGKAHHVDDDLYQYWITVAPTDASSELPHLSASAYIHLPDHHLGRRTDHGYRGPATIPAGLKAKSDADVLTSMRIVELRSAQICSRGSVSFPRQIQRGSNLEDWFDDCFALRVMTKKDAVVFFLNHQLNHGLVRLAGRDCRPRTEARIARANETLEYALPLLSLTRDATSPAQSWLLDPDADIYYAIAVSDTRAARALSYQIDRLPSRCTISVHPGLEDLRLQDWLNDFSATVDKWQPHVDWQAIRVRNVF